MQSDSALSSIALGISLLVFVFSSLIVAELTALRQPQVRSLLPATGLTAQVRELLRRHMELYQETAVFLGLASIAAGTASTVALVAGLTGANWGVIALSVLGLWLMLAFLRGGSRAALDHFTLSLLPPLALPTLVTVWSLAPLARGANLVQPLLQRLFHPQIPRNGPGDEGSPPEDLSLVEPDQEPLDPQERKMIRAILQLEETAVREIMVPRVDILAVDVGTPVPEVASMMLEGGHSRIPIYEETIDNIVGMVHARDLLRYLHRGDSPPHLRDLARPPYFIPDSKRVDDLLQELQEKRIHTAIVVDEYGGTAGLVTIEDALEEIVGEISDEFDIQEPTIQQVTENEAVMDARATLDQLNEAFSTQLFGEGFDTLGGFVYSQLGKIPSPGDMVLANGLRIQVLSTLGRRIKKIRVTKTQEQNNQDQR